MSNSYLQYTSKDYDSIYKDLTDSISGISDTWTSREDSDPGIVLDKLMSALGDMLSYNMDKQSLEYYGPTVKQRKNATKRKRRKRRGIENDNRKEVRIYGWDHRL